MSLFSCQSQSPVDKGKYNTPPPLNTALIISYNYGCYVIQPFKVCKYHLKGKICFPDEILVWGYLV